LIFLLSLAVLSLVYANIPNAPKLFDGNSQNVFSFVYGAGHMILALFAAYVFAVFCRSQGWVNEKLVDEGYVAPFRDFFARYGKLAIWVLMLVGFYRVSDIVMGVITNVFYADMGYSKSQIASITKVFGVLVTILGAFLGGLLAIRIGVMRALMVGAVLVATTNLSFMWLAQIGDDYSAFKFSLTIFSDHVYEFPTELFIVIVIDNLAQGFAIAAFIGWLSSLTNVSFTATQYAIFSSVMTLFPKLIGGFSGTMVNAMGYSNFFLVASLMGLPVVLLIHFLSSRLEVSSPATD
jgi:PAT family beta-lactamase induction signal transducer AmpG